MEDHTEIQSRTYDKIDLEVNIIKYRPGKPLLNKLSSIRAPSLKLQKNLTSSSPLPKSSSKGTEKKELFSSPRNKRKNAWKDNRKVKKAH